MANFFFLISLIDMEILILMSEANLNISNNNENLNVARSYQERPWQKILFRISLINFEILIFTFDTFISKKKNIAPPPSDAPVFFIFLIFQII